MTLSREERKAWEWRVMWAREISSPEPSHEYIGNEQLVKDILAMDAHVRGLEAEAARLKEAVSEMPGWIAAIKVERARQDAKWGEQNHADLYWLGILTEEVGELAKAIIENNGPSAAKELVQVASVCVAWMEAVKRRPRREGDERWIVTSVITSPRTGPGEML